MTRKKVRAAIVGASGYTGAELVRLLARHPDVGIVALTADRKAGQGMGHVFPHLAAAVDELHLPDLSTIEAVDWSGVDVAFCGLPHGTTQATVASLPDNVKVIDLSADFRLFDVDAYSQWYGHSHCAPALQAEAVYGITELARERMAGARLIANPGCYPTAVVLPLAPALAAGVVEVEDIIIDAKSGVTGAGRAAKETSLFAEVAEGIHAYGVASHRHTPEIEQALSWADRKSVV